MKESARRKSIIWVVLPAYNEEASLPALFEAVDEAMFESGLGYRIIIVDDGSRDRTLEVAKRFAERMPVIIERHEVNQGLGGTIRDGLVKAAALADANDIIVTMDADNSQTPGLILRMTRLVQEGCDVVIASRYQHGSRVIGVNAGRRALSYFGSLLVRALFPIPGVRDYTCGYRAYRAGVLKSVIERYGREFFDQEGFQCMVDILLKLRKENLVFGEAPLILRYDLKEGESKMNVGRTIRGTLLLLARHFRRQA